MRNAIRAGLMALALAATFIGSAQAQVPIVTYNPVTVKAPPGRVLDIETRINAPVRGDHLPVVLFVHGAGYSKDDYLVLPEYWAAHGFVVIQASGIDSPAVTLPPGAPPKGDSWRWRATDYSRILDAAAAIEDQAPGLKGRIDWSRVVVAGHSYGGQTAALLFGAKVRDPKTGAMVDLGDKRILAALMMAPPGSGADEDLLPDWRINAPYLKVDWSSLRRPALVVVGAKDEGGMTMHDWHWHADAYYHAPPGDKCLLVLPGSMHFMGGILGVHRTEVKDENPARVKRVETATLAFLRSAVDPKSSAWTDMAAELKAKADPADDFQCK